MHIYSVSSRVIQLVAGGYIEEHQGFYENLSDATEEARVLATRHFVDGWFERPDDDPSDNVVLYIYPENMTHGIVTIYRDHVIGQAEAAEIRMIREGEACYADWKAQELSQIQHFDNLLEILR